MNVFIKKVSPSLFLSSKAPSLIFATLFIPPALLYHEDPRRRNWFLLREKCRMKESIRRARALVQRRFMNLLSSWRQQLFLFTNKCGEAFKLLWIDPMKILRRTTKVAIDPSLLMDRFFSWQTNSITIFLFPFEGSLYMFCFSSFICRF